MSNALSEFKTQMTRIITLGKVNSLLDWDQQTYMPSGAAAARAEQCAVLSGLIHEMVTSDTFYSLLAQSEGETQGQDPDSDDVRMLAVARRSLDRQRKLPPALVEEMARHTALSQEVWVKARANSDFDAFAPSLEKMLDLTRQQAQYLGYKDHLYDALIDLYEPGTSRKDVAAMFGEIKPALVELTRAIASSANPVDAKFLYGDFPIAKQRELTLQAVKAIGYDFNRGRQDEAAHPFCTDFSRDDVRITTRFDANCLTQALYASLHEAGHALYEQGSPAEYEGTTLAGGTSLGIHESQSRLWENLVGRSQAYTHYIYPQLQAAFPTAFGGVAESDYYRAVNQVRPSLIRIEADEVTYNLHTLLRFELECALLDQRLAVEDLPDAWDALMEQYLGVMPPTDAEGCLQDVHWSAGLIGYFPTYSIGNLLSGQLWHYVRLALPELDEQISHGEFAPLLDWLRENVHRYGSKYLPRELVIKATGEPLQAKYYIEYLQTKYRHIYGLA